MTPFPAEPVETAEEPGAAFVLMRLVGGLAALSGGAGLGLQLSGTQCPETVRGAAWAATLLTALAAAGLVTAIGAWQPKRALVLASVLLLAGFAAAPFAPRVQQGLERSRQERTMSDLRSLATRIETHRLSTGSIPKTKQELVRLVQAADGEHPLALSDAWGTPFRYESDGQTFYLTAACRCALFDAREWQDYELGAVDDLRADLLMSNGSFLRYPRTGNMSSSRSAQEPPPR